jgi:hypothetical protein
MRDIENWSKYGAKYNHTPRSEELHRLKSYCNAARLRENSTYYIMTNHIPE